MKHRATLCDIPFSYAALLALHETGTVPGEDIRSLLGGGIDRHKLLEQCLEGADPNREQGWRDYAEALADHVATAPFRVGDHARERAAPHWEGEVIDVEWTPWPEGKTWGWRITIRVSAGEGAARFADGWDALHYGNRAEAFEKVEPQ